MIVEVTLLDGSIAKFDMDSKCSGQDLLDRVAEHLNLVRTQPYFNNFTAGNRGLLYGQMVKQFQTGL